MTEYIDKLEYLLEQYERRKLLNFILEILCFVFVVMFVYSYITTLILIVLIFVGVGVQTKLKITTKEPILTEEEIAHSVCFLMEAMIDYKKNGPRTEVRILTESYGKRDDLYDEFVALFPSYKSRKLKKLVTINRKNNKYFK